MWKNRIDKGKHKDKPADENDPKNQLQAAAVSSRGEVEASFVYSPGASVTSQLQEEATGRTHRTGSVPTVNLEGAHFISGSPRASSVSGRPQMSTRGAGKTAGQEDKRGHSLNTWDTYGIDEQDTGSASSKKKDGKLHRPKWVKKLASKSKKDRSSNNSTSSLTKDVRQEPAPAMMESGLGEEEGCYYEDEEEEEDEDKTPTPKLQRPADQTQQSPDSVFSPSSGQESSVCSSDDITGSEPPKFDEKERQNSLTIAEIVHDRAKAIKDTDAAEEQKQQNIAKIRKADEKLIEAVGKYKSQVKKIQSQLEAEQSKNKQQAKEIAALQQEKEEANAALIRVATMAPKGVGESVKEQFDSLKSENEKLAERAYTAEAAVLELRKGVEELTKRSSEVESQLVREHEMKLETERTQRNAVIAKKERRHSESITEKDKELEQLKSKIEVTTKMVSAKEAEMQKALGDAKDTEELLKVKDNELKNLLQIYDAAKAEITRNAHCASQLEEKQRYWEEFERKANEKEKQLQRELETSREEHQRQLQRELETSREEHQDALQKAKQEHEAALKQREDELQSQLSSSPLDDLSDTPAAQLNTEETEATCEESNKTDMQKMESLQKQVDHLTKQLAAAEAEVIDKTNEIDEMAALIISTKPGEALQDQAEFEKLRELLEQKEDEITSLKKTVEQLRDPEQTLLLGWEENTGAEECEQRTEELTKALEETSDATAQVSEKDAAIQRLNAEISAKDQQIEELQHKASTGSHAQEFEDEVDELKKDLARMEDLLHDAAATESELEVKVEELEEELRNAQTQLQPEFTNVSQQVRASAIQFSVGDDLSEELREKEQQLEDAFESRQEMEAEHSGAVRQLQAEVKARDELLELTKSAQEGSEQDAFQKVKRQYLNYHLEVFQLKKALQEYESQQHPEAPEGSFPLCARSLSHEDSSSSGLSSSAQLQQLKVALEVKNRHISNMETAARGFESTLKEHGQMKEHQTVQSKKIAELKEELKQANETIAHLQEEEHALKGEVGAARENVATANTTAAQETHSVKVQLEEATARADRLQTELEVSKSKCYELERVNRELTEQREPVEGPLNLKVQLGDASAKGEQLSAEVVEWQSRCSKLEDEHTELSGKLKQAEDTVKELQERIDHDFALKIQNEEDEGKKEHLQLFHQNKELRQTNSVLKNDQGRLSHNLAHARKEIDGLRIAVENAKAEALRQKRNFDSRSREHSEKLKELDQLRKKNTESAESLDVLKVKAATYKEDFNAERREREQIASAMVEQKATMELQYQELKEDYETKLRVNLQVAETLNKKIDELEKQLKDEAEQAEARLRDKEATHKDDIDLATAKEVTANDHMQNLTNDIQQLQGQLKQKSEELSSQIAHLQNELDATCQQRDDARADVVELDRELAGKAQQVKQYIKQVDDLRRLDENQKQDITALQHQNGDLQHQNGDLQHQNGDLQRQNGDLQHRYESLWNEAENLQKRVANLRQQLQMRLDEIQRLHEEHQEYVDYVSAQQKSNQLIAQAGARDVLREKEQLEMELRQLKKWMEQSGFSLDQLPQENPLPVPPRKPHSPATDSLAMARPNQGIGPHRQQYATSYTAQAGDQQPTGYSQYSSQPSNAGGRSVMVGQQSPQMNESGHQPRGDDRLQSDHDSLKNRLEVGIMTDIHNIAAHAGEERDTSLLEDVPFDPNLICPMCNLQFKIGEIQKFRRHVQNCHGTSGGNPPGGL